MPLKTITDKEGLYFLTSTVVDWVDVFTRPVYRYIIIDSLKY
jgi:putative transposase